MTEKEQKIINFCVSKVGMGYAWGAQGELLTRSRLNDLINQYPSYVSESKNGKWLGKQVYDCAGLVRKALKEVDVSVVSGATSQWNKTNWERKGAIDTLPHDHVCCLYRQVNGKTMQHTGVYIGNNEFIDARGSASGVLRSKMSTYPWTHWAIPRGLGGKQVESKIEVIKVLYTATVTATSGSSVNMRSGPSKGDARIKAVPLGATVEVIEVGDNWSKVVYDNLDGYMMNEFLVKNTASADTPQ